MRDPTLEELFARRGAITRIATELGISPQTVETHRKSITKKLRANGANLVRIAALYVAANGHREALAGR